MQQAVFALFVFKARLHAAGLEIFAVGAAGNFAVGVLCGHPHFQIVGFGCAKAHVAGAQGDYAIGQFEQLEDFFGMPHHFFERIVRLLGAHDLHHFHFVKLMLADEAAHIFAVGAGFGAEAGRMGGELERQFGRGQNALAHGVGKGYFRRGNQILGELALVAATGNVKQVFAEFRQLAGAQKGAVVDDIGGVVLEIAVLQRVGVEHKLRQRAVQAGDLAFHHGEARAGECGAGFEIQPQRRTQIHMVFHFEIECARCAHFAHFYVVGFVFAHRHAFVRQVGYAQQPFVELGLHGLVFGFGLLEAAFDLRHFGHGRIGFCVFALAFELADLLGGAVARGLQRFGLNLQRFACGFDLLETCAVEYIAACGQARGHGGGVVAEALDV